MKKNAFKSVYRYIGLCMIGTLMSAFYIPYAHADICFLPGESCFANERKSCDASCDCVGSNCCEVRNCPGVNNGSTCDGVVETFQIPGRACDLMSDQTSYCCHNRCLLGYEKMSDGTCLPACPANCPRKNGECTANPGYAMCNDSCLPTQQTGHRRLVCPNYVCDQGYEEVAGLEGCYLRCTINGQTHNSTTGECECGPTEEVCNNSCMAKCSTGQVRDADTCACLDSVPNCESPKEYLTTINNVKTCADCRDYTLRDAYCGDDVYSYDPEGYSYPSESCSQVTTNGRFVRDVQNGGGYCNRCPIPRSNPTTQAKNRYKCYTGNMEVNNYADFCYALGYTYNVSGVTCSSPFTATTLNNIRQYNSEILYVRSGLNKLNAIGTSGYEASSCSACPFDSRFYNCPFKCTYFTEAQLNSSPDYFCIQCPGRHLAEGNDGYFCTKKCSTGLTWDEDLQECVSPCMGYKDLDPIDVCNTAAECNLESPDSIFNYVISGGYSASGYDEGYGMQLYCQVLGLDIRGYTMSEAAKLRKRGYYCHELSSNACPGLYDCKPAKPLAKAVRENGGTCAECGSSPKKYQCTIGNVTIDEPSDLCDYLGFTISQLDYWSYFDGKDGVASCQGMACGVFGNYVGLVSADSRYKCQCRSGYIMTVTGCQRTSECPEGMAYSDSISGCVSICPVGYTYSGGDCIDQGPKDEDDCWAEGYIWNGTETEFQCGYYVASQCAKCPYDNRWLKCTPNPDWSGDCGSGSGGCEGESDGCDIIDNVTKCQMEGYVQYPVGIPLIDCKDCPYPTEFRMVKDCAINGYPCALQGYTTPLSDWAYELSMGQAVCVTCPMSPEWLKDCHLLACNEGNSDACSAGETMPDLTPQEQCANAGYRKITTSEVRMINEGSGSCLMCPYTNDLVLNQRYVRNCVSERAKCEAEHYLTSEEQKETLVATGNYTCEPCPYWNKLYRCSEISIPEPDPCEGYNIVSCPSITHQCLETIPECGCINCQEAPGVYCNQGEVCSEALNEWGKCEGTCSCEGVTCTDDKVCTDPNPCGMCPSESNCICSGATCNSTEFCNGTTNQCGNCTSTCEAKTCVNYGYQESSSCSSEHQKPKLVPSSTVGGLICYECVYKGCTDYGYKTYSSECSYSAYPVHPRTGMTCYSCKECTETCYGERYRSNLTCAPEHQLSCTNCDNETRYYCDGYSDDGYSGDGYSGDGYSADGYSDSGSNCKCKEQRCDNVSCSERCDNIGWMGSRVCWCDMGIAERCILECCTCPSEQNNSRCTSSYAQCVDPNNCGG